MCSKTRAAVALKPKKRHRLATLADVARRLGVSEATVSLVVSDHPRISRQTKLRVRECIRELGYRPDLVARALVTGRSNLIGLMVPDAANPFFAEVFRGAEQCARAKGYYVLLSSSSFDLGEEEKLIDQLLDLKVGGLIASPPFVRVSQMHRSVWTRLRERRFPLVLLNRAVTPGIFHQILPDSVQGMRLSAEFLSRLGHTRVAYISGVPEILPVRQRLAAYKRLVTEFGWDRDARLLEKTSAFTAQGGYKAARRLWQKCRRRPTAILALSDTVAAGVLKFLGEAGVKVPEDVSLMGFDGTAYSEFSLIGITTIELPLYDMGCKAVEMLDQAIRGPGGPVQSLTIPPRLVERGSTGPARTGSGTG